MAAMLRMHPEGERHATFLVTAAKNGQLRKMSERPTAMTTASRRPETTRTTKAIAGLSPTSPRSKASGKTE
jgi:hypothetical protein